MRRIDFNLKDSFSEKNLGNAILADLERSNLTQIQALQKLQDTLLPKLVSGDVRVKLEIAA